jgi:hypothetical protein
MWWPIVFWILLIPLIVIELIVYIKTRKLSWLVYALAIFTYVVAVTYTINVFDLGRNAVILILLASAGLMWLLGKRLGKTYTPIKPLRTTAIIIAAIMVILFVISVVFGKAQETITPVPFVKLDDVAIRYNERGEDLKPMAMSQVTLLKREISNSFFLPVPIVHHDYRACLATDKDPQELYMNSDYIQEHEEVGPGQAKVISVRFSPARIAKDIVAREVLVYESSSRSYSWAPCTDVSDREPTYRIPVQ